MLDVLKISKCITVCDCCHKSNLKLTIEIILDTDVIVHYCKICACELTGKSMQDIMIEIRKIQQSIIELAKEEYFSSDEYKKLFAVFKTNAFNPYKINFNYRELIKLANIRKDFIAKKYNIHPTHLGLL